MDDQNADTPPSAPPGKGRPPAAGSQAYQRVALHMQQMAVQARSDEARREFVRLAVLYSNLAARATNGSYPQPDLPPLTAYSGVVRIPLQETYFHFNREGITRHAPRAPGIYALWNKDFWIYIGECRDLQERLLHHLDDGGACVKSGQPTTFGFELIEQGQDRVARRAALIRDLMPIC